MTHHSRRFSFALAALLFSCGALAAPLVMPAKQNASASLTVEQVRKATEALNSSIGSFPPKLASDAERSAVYKQWSGTLQQARRLAAAAPAAEAPLALLSELYRQGHNLDVEQAGELADETIAQCLAAYPASVACHFSAAYFYLSVNPSYAPKGEASLLWLREHFKPDVKREVEQGLVFAYLYEGRTDDALKQVDYFLTLDPTAKWAREFRTAISEGKVEIKHD